VSFVSGTGVFVSTSDYFRVAEEFAKWIVWNFPLTMTLETLTPDSKVVRITLGDGSIKTSSQWYCHFQIFPFRTFFVPFPLAVVLFFKIFFQVLIRKKTIVCWIIRCCRIFLVARPSILNSTACHITWKTTKGKVGVIFHYLSFLSSVCRLNTMSNHCYEY